MVNNVVPGYSSDGLAPVNGFQAYKSITTNGSEILKGGKVGEGAGHGVENSSCIVNGGIKMDWATDIVGNYQVGVTLTISELSE